MQRQFTCEKNAQLHYGQENIIKTRYRINKNQDKKDLKVISRGSLIKNIQNGL